MFYRFFSDKFFFLKIKFLLSYLFGGLICLLIDFLVFSFCLKFFTWFFSTTISICISTFVGFFVYNNYVYIKRKQRILFFVFFLSNLLALLLVQLMMYIGIEILLLDPFLSKFIASIIIIIFNFVIRSFCIWNLNTNTKSKFLNTIK